MGIKIPNDVTMTSQSGLFCVIFKLCIWYNETSHVSSIYQLAALRLSDKFDPSMTLGKLLANNAQLFIFISKMIMMITTRMSSSETHARLHYTALRLSPVGHNARFLA